MGQFSSTLTNSNIKKAVRLWNHDPEEATRFYGPIEMWDTNQVTNMCDLFGGNKNFNEDISK